MLDKLELLSKSECYAKASQRPQLRAKAPHDIALDFEFTKLYRSIEPELANNLKSIGADDGMGRFVNVGTSM